MAFVLSCTLGRSWCWAEETGTEGGHRVMVKWPVERRSSLRPLAPQQSAAPDPASPCGPSPPSGLLHLATQHPPRPPAPRGTSPRSAPRHLVPQRPAAPRPAAPRGTSPRSAHSVTSQRHSASLSRLPMRDALFVLE